MTTRTPTTDPTRTVEQYLEVWNTADPGARTTAARTAFADQVQYVDPLVDVRGTEQLVAVVAAVRDQFPGCTFRLAGTVDGHHDQLRFRWSLGPDDAESLVDGFDVAVLGTDGRILEVRGFLDKVPSP